MDYIKLFKYVMLGKNTHRYLIRKNKKRNKIGRTSKVENSILYIFLRDKNTTNHNNCQI